MLILFRRNYLLRRLFANRKIQLGGILFALLLIFLFVAPYFIAHSYDEQIRGNEMNPISWQYPMGTDALGRSLLPRIIVGIEISLLVAFIASLINLTIGIFYGVLAGYIGGVMDNIMMRMVDILSSISEILYLILIMIFLRDQVGNGTYLSNIINDSHGLVAICVTLGVAFWIPFARILRSQVLSIKEQDFIAAARSYGASNTRIIFKYILPNCIPLILVTMASRIPVAIFFEAFLSFIGLGITPPLPSLGSLLADGLGSMTSAPHLLLFPAIFLVIVILIFNIIIDGLRDVFDYKVY